MNKATCCECGERKSKEHKGAWTKYHKRIYVDDSGKQWWGMKCPACRNPSAEFLELNPLTTRKCRACGGALRKDRYFNHVECANLDRDFALEYAHVGRL